MGKVENRVKSVTFSDQPVLVEPIGWVMTSKRGVGFVLCWWIKFGSLLAHCIAFKRWRQFAWNLRGGLGGIALRIDS